MTSTLRTAIAMAAGLAILGSTAVAQNEIDKSTQRVLGARQSLMQLNAFNIGLLGAMAKGEIDYDSEAAQSAAANLVALSSIDQARMWPEGTSRADLGEDATRALPAIWENRDDFFSHIDDLNTAATDMEAAAGESLDALRANMKALGDACGACHDDYRASEDEDG